MNAATSSGLPVLWQLKASNYNEKARFALDYKRVPHLRRTAVPGRHAEIARKLTGQPRFPVLVVDGNAVADSTRIIELLERRFPQPSLYPADPAARRRALELEDFFDEELGAYVRLLFLHVALPEPALLLGAFVPELSGVQYVGARLLYPALRRRIAGDFEVRPDKVDDAVAKVRAAGERFQAELQPSGYLVGDSFTVADLTLAALVAPPVAPVQFPYPQPQREHPRFAEIRALLAEYGLLEWTREIYARHRGRSAEVVDADTNTLHRRLPAGVISDRAGC